MTENLNAPRVAVVGAGPGGYPAAFLAADMGMRVTLIDPEPNPGGVCLYRGCIPTKTLLHIVNVIREAEEAAQWGVKFSSPKIQVDQMRSWKDRVVQKLTSGVGYLCQQRKIRYIQGKARFVDPKTLLVDKIDGSSEKFIFDYAILATGSSSALLPEISIESSSVMDSASALELKDLPKSLLVVGGGYVGLELGSIYARLGSRVSVVEMMPKLLPGADHDLIRIFTQSTRELFKSVMLSTTVVQLEEEQNGIKVTLREDNGTTKHAVYEKVLITVGREPNSRGLGLEHTKVEVDDKGFVKVDEQRQTAESSIFAVGDVVGEPLLAHKATREGKIAVQSIAGQKVAFKPRAIPAVLFTDPQIAWCGLTETEAEKEGIDIRVASFPWGASGRAATLGRSDGLTKLIINPKTERILGVGIVGPCAGELISEAALAVEMEASASDVLSTIHPHPTLSETLMEASEVFYGRCTHFYRQKRNEHH